MQLISEYNKGIRFLSSVINSFSKYTFFPPKVKKSIATANAFQKNLDESEGYKQTKYG